MEGGHFILRALHQLLEGGELKPEAPAGPFEPFQLGWLSRITHAWHGRWLYAKYDSYRQPRIVKKPENAVQSCRVQVRTYDSARRLRFKELATRRISPGPLRDSRATIIGLARAYRTMATESGRPREHYLFPNPLPIVRNRSRPALHGNYVTIPFLIFASEDLDHWARADSVATMQLREYQEKGHDAAMWSMYRAASRWPLGLTSLLTTHRRPRAAAGYTGYQFDDSVTRLGEAKITNIAGAGPMDCHPGWLLGRTTFGDSMSLSITYFEDYFDGPNVRKFLDLLERELFED
jgi:hypothetical protein